MNINVKWLAIGALALSAVAVLAQPSGGRVVLQSLS
jgi:hypothetical protein